MSNIPQSFDITKSEHNLMDPEFENFLRDAHGLITTVSDTHSTTSSFQSAQTVLPISNDQAVDASLVQQQCFQPASTSTPVRQTHFATPATVTPLRTTLERRRNQKLMLVKNIFHKFQSINPQNVLTYQPQFERLAHLQTEFDAIQTELLDLNMTDEDFLIAQNEFDDSIFEAQHLYAKNKELASIHHASFTTSSQSLPNCPISNKPAGLRLPKIEMPKFNGTMSEWGNFFSLYNEMIHKSNLSDIEKFQVLRSSLKDDALDLIKNLAFIPRNYVTAYALLVEHYQNDRKHITNHFNGLLDLPDLTSNNLSLFFSKLQEHTQALESLDYKLTGYATLLVSVLIRKFSTYHRRRFEDSRLDSTKFPTIQEIITFLKKEYTQMSDIPNKSRPTSRPSCPSSSHSTPKISRQEYLAALASTSNSKDPQSPNPNSKPQLKNGAPSPRTSHTDSNKGICKWCHKNHNLFQCPEFLKMTPSARREAVAQRTKTESVPTCFNCLGPHYASDCTSSNVCCHCQKKHHSLLHIDSIKGLCQTSNKFPEASAGPSDTEDLAPSTNSQTCNANLAVGLIGSSRLSTGTILPTLHVLVSSPSGHKVVARAILDSGAQNSFITISCAQLLYLKRQITSSDISGLSEINVKTFGEVTVNLSTPSGTTIAPDQTMVLVRAITTNLPSAPIDRCVRELVSDYPLADPTFDIPGPIDLLLGADLFGEIVLGDCRRMGPSLPFILSTKFGYVILGKQPVNKSNRSSSSTPSVNLFVQNSSPTSLRLEPLIERFWEVDDIKPLPCLPTPEEKYAEEMYSQTTIQQDNKRYMVRLPFKPNPPQLGESQSLARKQFFQLEKRLQQNPKLKGLYVDFMTEYLKNGYMKKVHPPPPNSQHFYLPHHGVLKEASSTTKLRTVFNASAKSSTGLSLNDLLLPGPKLQNDIPTIILNFRSCPVVFAADIKQIYLQIDLHPDDHPFQLIFWRSHPNEPLETYALTTVTFGINSSPFLAIRTLHQIATDYGHLYPRAAKILLENSYVDDIISGAMTQEEAKCIIAELIALLALGGFFLRKWTSSHPSILADIPQDHLETPKFQDFDNPWFSLLGLRWLSAEDAFTLSVNLPPHLCTPKTKRQIVAVIASLYDPCGYVTPVILKAKAFIQELWVCNATWDEPLAEGLLSRWNNFFQELTHLRSIRIPRRVNAGGDCVQVHGFCDASEIAYAASVYIRTPSLSSSQPAQVTLIMAKSRVAPLQKLSIPRLELCAAALLDKLFKHILPQIRTCYTVQQVFAWSDSTVALTWIQTPAFRLKTFVSNRVAAIQANKDIDTWRHIKSTDNPSDCASRGLFPNQMSSCNIWWNGPEWLQRPEEEWPTSLPTHPSTKPTPELKPVVSVLTAIEPPITVFPDLSSWDKVVRSHAYTLRFIQRLKDARHTAKTRIKRKNIPTSYELLRNTRVDPLLPSEIELAEVSILKRIQNQVFEKDIKVLKNKLLELSKTTDENSKKKTQKKRKRKTKKERKIQKKEFCSPSIQRLNPFIDNQGILRVGGRLRHASILESAKYQIILPSDLPLVRLLVIKYHQENLHAPPQLLQSLLRQKYWILSAKSLIRSVVHKCIKCFRAKPRNDTPLMSDLPAPRVQQNPPFFNVGTDLAGPYQIKIHLARYARVVPIYLCVFICFSTKAVHIETVHQLTTPAFLAALQRFSARRGTPGHIYCDRGSNFVGADNYFQTFITKLKDDLLIKPLNHVTFHFNPPSAPHQGGLWEAAVKSMKTHLRRTLGLSILTIEEFQTLVIKIEAMLNSRPLTPLSSDPNDMTALTPGHFLIGRPLVAPPEKDYSNQIIPPLQRWKQVEALNQHIWQRWHLEYLHTLQIRNKWSKETQSLQLNQMVLIHEDHVPPLAWRLGRIVKLHPGTDGVVRVVTLKTSTSQLQRPAQKVYPLPLS